MSNDVPKMNQGTVDFPLRVVELNLLALASDFVDYSDPSERPRARRNPARTAPHREGGLPARKNNRFRKNDDSENMDIPVMPHPGTDTQASPYQSRQTKEIT